MWARLSDCCFLGNGKWNKETQKVQRRWTTNYEQEGGKRGPGEEEEEERFSYGRHVPPNPVLPLSCSSILYTRFCFPPSSVVSCLRCSMFFHLRSHDSFVLRALVSHHHIRGITLGVLPMMTGLMGPLHVLFLGERHKYSTIWFMCVCCGGQR